MIKTFCYTFILLLSTSSAAQPTWHIVSEHFPPYISSTDAGNSWLVDITQAALASQQIQSEVEITTWIRALQLVKRQKRTAVLGAYYSKQRSKVFYYSKALGIAKTGFFKRTDKAISFDGTLESIKAHSICVGSDYVVSDEFAANHELAVTVSKDLKTCLKLLYKGRVELVAGTHQPGQFWLEHLPELNQSTPYKIEYIQPDIASHKMHLIVPISAKDAQQNIAIFDKGLKHIVSSGELQRILKRHNFTEQEIADYIRFVE